MNATNETPQELLEKAIRHYHANPADYENARQSAMLAREGLEQDSNTPELIELKDECALWVLKASIKRRPLSPIACSFTILQLKWYYRDKDEKNSFVRRIRTILDATSKSVANDADDRHNAEPR